MYTILLCVVREKAYCAISRFDNVAMHKMYKTFAVYRAQDSKKCIISKKYHWDNQDRQKYMCSYEKDLFRN